MSPSQNLEDAESPSCEAGLEKQVAPITQPLATSGVQQQQQSQDRIDSKQQGNQYVSPGQSLEATETPSCEAGLEKQLTPAQPLATSGMQQQQQNQDRIESKQQGNQYVSPRQDLEAAETRSCEAGLEKQVTPVQPLATSGVQQQNSRSRQD